jgi:hypothetical protein
MYSMELMFLGACFVDEIMTSSRIKQDDSRMSIQRNRTREDLLALGNVLHGSLVDAVGSYNSHLLRTTGRMGDVAMSGILLQRGAFLSKVA